MQKFDKYTNRPLAAGITPALVDNHLSFLKGE